MTSICYYHNAVRPSHVRLPISPEEWLHRAQELDNGDGRAVNMDGEMIFEAQVKLKIAVTLRVKSE